MKLSGKKGTEQSKKKSVGKAKKASEVIKVPGDWLYMTPQEIGVRQIYEAFGEQDGYELEIWEDAGVLEIGMSDGASVDIETAQIHPKDELTASFAAEHLQGVRGSGNHAYHRTSKGGFQQPAQRKEGGRTAETPDVRPYGGIRGVHQGMRDTERLV